MNTLTVIVPFYNEKNFLDKSVNRLLEHNIYSKILLVDDNSNDGSSEIGKKLDLENKNIDYIKTPQNGGKGNAIKYAQSFIETSHVVIHDADLEYFPKDIVEMFEISKKNSDELILGSRFIGSKKRINKYSRTLLANKFLSLFFSMVFQKRVTDVATCYKLIPTQYFSSIEFEQDGFAIEIEILAKYLKFSKKSNIHEVPIDYEARTYAEGKKIKTVDGILYLYTTLKYRFF